MGRLRGGEGPLLLSDSTFQLNLIESAFQWEWTAVGASQSEKRKRKTNEGVKSINTKCGIHKVQTDTLAEKRLTKEKK